MLAVTVRVQSLILASWVSFLHQVGSFAAPFGLGAAALARCVHLDRSRGRLPCIIMEEGSRLSCSVRPQCIFSGGQRQSLGKSVVMRTLRNARSKLVAATADDDGKTFAATFTTATGLARGSATLIARQVLANDEASEPTRIRKTRVLLVDRTVDEVSMVSASCFETVGYHCTCCP